MFDFQAALVLLNRGVKLCSAVQSLELCDKSWAADVCRKTCGCTTTTTATTMTTTMKERCEDDEASPFPRRTSLAHAPCAVYGTSLTGCLPLRMVILFKWAPRWVLANVWGSLGVAWLAQATLGTIEVIEGMPPFTKCSYIEKLGQCTEAKIINAGVCNATCGKCGMTTTSPIIGGTCRDNNGVRCIRRIAPLYTIVWLFCKRNGVIYHKWCD